MGRPASAGALSGHILECRSSARSGSPVSSPPAGYPMPPVSLSLLPTSHSLQEGAGVGSQTFPPPATGIHSGAQAMTPKAAGLDGIVITRKPFRVHPVGRVVTQRLRHPLLLPHGKFRVVL